MVTVTITMTETKDSHRAIMSIVFQEQSTPKKQTATFIETTLSSCPTAVDHHEKGTLVAPTPRLLQCCYNHLVIAGSFRTAILHKP